MKTKQYGQMSLLTRIHRRLTVNKVWYKALIPIKDDWTGEY